MNKYAPLLLLLALTMLSLSNCTKEEIKNRENKAYRSEAYLDFDELNMSNSEVTIQAQYPPNETPEQTVIHLSTNANPEGITLTAIPEENEVWLGYKEKMKEMRSTIRVEAAHVNRAEYNQIAVADGGDTLFIDVDNGSYTTSYPVNMDFFPQITFWTFVDPTNTEATLFLYDISQGKTDEPVVHISSDSDVTGFDLKPEYNDPMIYSWPRAFHSFMGDFYVDKSGNSDPANKKIGVKEGEKIYVTYRNEVFYLTAFEEIHWPMPKM